MTFYMKKQPHYYNVNNNNFENAVGPRGNYPLCHPLCGPVYYIPLKNRSPYIPVFESSE